MLMMDGSNNSQKRGKKVTEEQKEIMVDFIESSPKMIKGKFDAEFTTAHSRKLWHDLAVVLNSCNGAVKDAKEWRKCWQDIRRVAKTKASAINGSRLTRGGKEYGMKLTTLQERICSLISECTIDGYLDVKETLFTNTDDGSFVTYREETEVCHDTDEVDLKPQKTFDISSKDSVFKVPIVSTVKTAGTSSILTTPLASENETVCTSTDMTTPTGTDRLAEIAAAKLELKREYYRLKIEQMRRIADSLQTIATTLTAKK